MTWRVSLLALGAVGCFATLVLATVGRWIDPLAAVAAGLGGLGVIAALAAGVVRREQRVAVAATEAARTLDADGCPAPGEAADALKRSLAASRERVAALEAEWQDLHAGREAAEAALRDSEERYALAIRGADDGLWEWNLASGRMHFSPRWKSMLGYGEDDVPDRTEAWLERVHPHEREAVEAQLRRHAAGETARFESEHRLRHRDGTYRWMLSRGVVIRTESGHPYRVVGLHTDITARKQVQESLIEVADSLSSLSGEECLRELARRFASVLNVREVFVTECCNFDPTTRLRMLARWDDGQFARCVDFDMVGTSCEEVIRGGATLYVPQGLGDRWPAERQYRRESYLGLPCLDAQGRVIGNIACADGEPMRRDLPHLAILKIFAIRAAVELERRQVERNRLATET